MALGLCFSIADAFPCLCFTGFPRARCTTCQGERCYTPSQAPGHPRLHSDLSAPGPPTPPPPLLHGKPGAAHPLCFFSIPGANGRGLLVAEGSGKWPPEPWDIWMRMPTCAPVFSAGRFNWEKNPLGRKSVRYCDFKGSISRDQAFSPVV